MFIKQISIYLENVKGSLRELTELLGKNGINLLALSIADTTGFGIIRCIVPSVQVENAMQVLRDNGNTARVNNVVCVGIPHRPLGLAGVLKILEDNDLFVEYSYSFCRSTTADAVLIIRTNDKDKTAKVLSDAGVRLLSPAEVDKF